MTDLIEDQYYKVFEKYPQLETVNTLIHHLRIPLINNVFLDLDFKKYPKRPKAKLIKPNGEEFDNLKTMITSLKTWKKKEAPDILELIHEIVLVVERMEKTEVMIKKELLEGILALARDKHPNEIVGLLRIENGVTTEFVLPPGAISNSSNAVFFPSRIPLDSSLVGTVHSHPSGNPYPSSTDLERVFRSRFFNFIVAYPYNFQTVRCFDQLGNELQYKLVS